MFRCARNSLISGLFVQAGLKNISVKEVTGKMNCKTTDVYWNGMTGVGAMIVAAHGKADDAMREKIKKEVYQAVNEKYLDGNILVASGAFVIYGEK